MGWRDSFDKPSKQPIKETHYSGKKKKEFSDEQRLKIGLKSKSQWEDPSFREKMEEVLRENAGKKPNLKSQEQTLQDFRHLHGDRYDYSKVKYVSSIQKVIIICHEHGEFLQTPHRHKRSGCPRCGRMETGRKNSKKLKGNTPNNKRTTPDVIEQFRSTHGDRYDYSKVEFVNQKTKVIIICHKHGESLVGVRGHIDGSNCPKCVRARTTSDVIEQFRSTHGDRYDYSKVEYGGNASKVIIICHEHGEFLQVPNNHKNGNGCPKCGRVRGIQTLSRKRGKG